MFNTLSSKISLFTLRLAMGWFYFYAGITKVLDSEWSAAGYLKGAETFPSFYTWLITPGVIEPISWLNQWSLTLLGISLLLGIFVRFSSVLGVALMFLYYLPVLNFPYAGAHGFIVDEHIIYILVLVFFTVVGAGRIWGIDGWLIKKCNLKVVKFLG